MNLWDLPAEEQAQLKQVVRDKLPLILAYAEDKGWVTEQMDHLDYLFTEDGQVANNIQVEVLDGYVLLYSIVTCWWMKGSFLLEQFLVSTSENHDFRKALADIEVLARKQGCRAVVIGTAAAPNNKTYSRLLQRYGFREAAYQLIKEL